MFVVEKNVALPVYSRRLVRAKKTPKYPFHSMDVGDSFVINEEICKKVAASAFVAKKAGLGTFTVRRQEDGTYRCWRTA